MWKARAAFASAKSEVYRLSSDINGLKEKSKELRSIRSMPPIERGKGTGGPRNILIREWRIYSGTRGRESVIDNIRDQLQWNTRGRGQEHLRIDTHLWSSYIERPRGGWSN